MVIIVCSTCGGTAVGVSKRGHTVVIVHGTCGGWGLASEGGAPSLLLCAGPVGVRTSSVAVPLVITPPVVIIIAVVRQWRIPKKGKGTHLVRRRCRCGCGAVAGGASVSMLPPPKKKGGYIPCPSSPSLLVVMLFQVVSQGQCKKNPKKKRGGGAMYLVRRHHGPPHNCPARCYRWHCHRCWWWCYCRSSVVAPRCSGASVENAKKRGGDLPRPSSPSPSS